MVFVFKGPWALQYEETSVSTIEQGIRNRSFAEGAVPSSLRISMALTGGQRLPSHLQAQFLTQNTRGTKDNIEPQPARLIQDFGLNEGPLSLREALTEFCETTTDGYWGLAHLADCSAWLKFQMPEKHPCFAKSWNISFLVATGKHAFFVHEAGNLIIGTKSRDVRNCGFF